MSGQTQELSTSCSPGFAGSQTEKLAWNLGNDKRETYCLQSPLFLILIIALVGGEWAGECSLTKGCLYEWGCWSGWNVGESGTPSLTETPGCTSCLTEPISHLNHILRSDQNTAEFAYKEKYLLWGRNNQTDSPPSADPRLEDQTIRWPLECRMTTRQIS